MHCGVLDARPKLPAPSSYRVPVPTGSIVDLTIITPAEGVTFLLDEPLGGVDPVARERIVSTIIKTYSEDSSIIISTHLVHDVETIFDDICMINEGEIILQGSAEDLRSEHAMSIDQLYIKRAAGSSSPGDVRYCAGSDERSAVAIPGSLMK